MAMAIARGRSMGDINITPLVDVMLVLLVIFMVTVPAVTKTNVLDQTRGISLDTVKPTEVRLHLTAGDVVEWNGEALSLEQLQARMESAARLAGSDAMAQPVVKLDAEEGVEYELLARVLARASNAGLVRIQLADGG
jgi:biopolymer transport protein ExbD